MVRIEDLADELGMWVGDVRVIVREHAAESLALVDVDAPVGTRTS
jgi:hypothetical protein